MANRIDRSHYRNADGSNYLPPGRIYGHIGQVLITGSFQQFTLVIQNTDTVAHSYYSFHLMVGGVNSSGMPDDNQPPTELTLQPGQQGTLTGGINLPAAGSYQPQLSGTIDGVSFGPVNCGPAVTVSPVPLSLLIGNNATPPVGNFPGTVFTSQSAIPLITISKFTVQKTGNINAWRLWIPASPGYEQSYQVALYNDNGGKPSGSPFQIMESYDFDDSGGWKELDQVGTIPVLLGDVIWIGVIAASGNNMPAQSWSAGAGECYWKVKSNGVPQEAWWPTLGLTDTADDELASYNHDTKLVMIAGYGN
jgi:hypothetical protein